MTMFKSSTNPKDIEGNKKVGYHNIPWIVLKAWSIVHNLGAKKYGRFNWRQTGASQQVYVSAIMRHMDAYVAGEETDPESGQSHLAHVMACCAILQDAKHHGKLVEDNNQVTVAALSVEEDSDAQDSSSYSLTKAGIYCRTPFKLFKVDSTELAGKIDKKLLEERKAYCDSFGVPKTSNTYLLSYNNAELLIVEDTPYKKPNAYFAIITINGLHEVSNKGLDHAIHSACALIKESN